MKHILALLLALLPMSEARAVPCVLLNRTNGIILFDSNTPGTTSAVIPVSGLGTYSPVGPLGISFSAGVGLDIFGGLTLFAGDDGGTARLFAVNRSTGTAAPVLGAIGGNPAIGALTIVPTTLPPTLPVSVRISGPKRIVTALPVATVRGSANCAAGIRKVEFKVGKGKARKAKGTKRWAARVALKPGNNVVSVRATGNNLIVSKPARVTIARE